MNKKIRLNYIMQFVAAFAVVIAVYAIITYGQTYVHADSAISFRFWNAIKADRNLYPRTWNGANGEIYAFNTMPIAIFTSIIFKNKVFSRALASAISFLLACIGMVWVSKKCFNNKAWIFMLPMYCLFISSDNSKDMNLFQAAYCPQMVAFTFLAAIFLGIVEKDYISKKWIGLHSILLFLMIVGGMRYVAEYLLPIGCATIIILLIKYWNVDKKHLLAELIQKIALLLIPAIAGFLVNKYICATRNMNLNGNSKISINLSINSMFESFKQMLINAAAIFGFNDTSNMLVNTLSIMVALFICVILPALLLTQVAKLTVTEQGYLLFAYSHNLIMFSVIILCGMTAQRYILSIVQVSIILSGIYLYRVCFKNSVLKYVIYACVLLLTVFYSYGLIKTTQGWSQKLSEQKRVCETLVEKGVTKVYGTYWVGYPFEIYSDGKLISAGVNPGKYGLFKYLWHVDDHVYEKTSGKSCLVLTKEENDALNLEYNNNDNIERIVGKKYEQLILNDVYLFNHYTDIYYTDDLIAYVFDEDISERILDGTDDGLLIPREMDFNDLGGRQEDKIYLTLGGVIHGPYANIDKGHYHVTIEGENLSICGAAVMSEQAQENIIYTVESINDKTIEIDLNILENIEDIQFYVTNANDDTAVFYDIVLEKQ